MDLAPAAVLAAYGVGGSAVALDGGQGTSVRAGDLVLKPGVSEAEVAWLAGLCSRLVPTGFRLPAPVPALDGRHVVDGWMATAYAEGSPVPDDDRGTSAWLPVLAATDSFHAATTDEPMPEHLAARDDRWARADRAAWGETSLRAGPRSAALVEHLRELLLDEHLRAQLVHGDLSGNVLLHPGLPPAVIDVSPYWRPAAYARAVVVVDALLWWESDPSLVAIARPVGLDAARWRSLLARAAVFRLLAFDEPSRERDDVDVELPRYADIVRVLSSPSR